MESQDEIDERELQDGARAKLKQHNFRVFKRGVKAAAVEAANRRAAYMISKVESEIEREDIFAVPPRDIRQMHEFGYEIINRELSRLNLKSSTCGLSDDEIQSLMRLMSTLNTTEKTKKSVNEEIDETKQREGESDDDYRERLENAIKR